MNSSPLTYNHAVALTMHIDLNSCFATVEQQSRPQLRGRPVVVMNRKSTNASIVAASYEAKRLGVKMGMRLEEIKKLAPGVVAVETDPLKYHFVYQKLMTIMKSYTPNVVMKSIDEGVMDFADTVHHVHKRSLENIAQEIKERLKSEIGCYMTCNIGIAPNRFLAKTAAGLHKPDGLDVITYKNLRAVFAQIKLTDLTGIADRNSARLAAVGITTPLLFLDADEATLSQIVFRGKPGRDWYRRLRGHEVDAAPTKLGIVGRQYVLEKRYLQREDVLQRLHFLCVSTGEKLRGKERSARGILVYARCRDGSQRWMARYVSHESFSTTQDIYAYASMLFANAPAAYDIQEIGISCYLLSPTGEDAPLLWEEKSVMRDRKITAAADDINTRYGAFSLQPAHTLGLEKIMAQKIPFGSIGYFDLLAR